MVQQDLSFQLSKSMRGLLLVHLLQQAP